MNMDFRARMVYLRKMSKEAVLNNLLVLTQLRLKVPAVGGLPSEKTTPSDWGRSGFRVYRGRRWLIINTFSAPLHPNWPFHRFRVE